MVVLDTSAVTAVVFGEPDAEMFFSVMLANAGDLQMSAGTAVEVGIVVEARQGSAATKDLGILVDRLGMATVPVDRAQVEAAVAASRRFGKGRHRRASIPVTASPMRWRNSPPRRCCSRVEIS